MVLMVEKLCHSLKVSSKLDSHHHRYRRRRSHNQPHSEALSASLQAFRSEVSDCLNQPQLSSNSKPRSSEFLSLTKIRQCLDLLSNVNKAFAKLVMDINYPMSKWEAPSVEDYLRCSLKALDLLNSINSSLSLLRRARLTISHALILIDTSSPPSSTIQRLKESQHLKKLNNKYLEADGDSEEEEEIRISSRSCKGEEWVVCQALKAMDLSFCEAAEMVRKCVLIKEVEEVNDEAAKLVVSVAVGESCNDCERRKELERKLEGMEKEVDVIGKKVDGLFSEILGGRAELLDALRWRREV